jgi:hypothetical protein
MTSVMKNKMEMYCNIFFVFREITGKYLENEIPAIIGMPMIIITVSNICEYSISSGCSIFPAMLLIKFTYNPPHSLKLNGVINMASMVEIAVNVTDNSEFPLDRDVIKFEMLPPGHAATRIIPMAAVGVITLLKIITRMNVMKGRKIN